MPYRLRDNVSYCQVDGHLIFLDLEEDRYFQLSHRLEGAFFAFLCDNVQLRTEMVDLVRQNVLIHVSDAISPLRESEIKPPCHSALEHEPTALRFDALALLEVFVIVCSTQLQLKSRRFKYIVDALVKYRQRRTANRPSVRDETSLLEAAGKFRWARLYVPIETCCLLDSLSMLRFLTRRHLSGNLIFGVTRGPFTAHCWVQAGDWVLNDTMGNVIAHTPIRKV